MYIKKLHIENFRCYKEQEVTFDKRINLVIGNNGAGKTSVLSAIRYEYRIPGYIINSYGTCIQNGSFKSFYG